jgi:hypothetical protein
MPRHGIGLLLRRNEIWHKSLIIPFFYCFILIWMLKSLYIGIMLFPSKILDSSMQPLFELFFSRWIPNSYVLAGSTIAAVLWTVKTKCFKKKIEKATSVTWPFKNVPNKCHRNMISMAGIERINIFPIAQFCLYHSSVKNFPIFSLFLWLMDFR